MECVVSIDHVDQSSTVGSTVHTPAAAPPGPEAGIHGLFFKGSFSVIHCLFTGPGTELTPEKVAMRTLPTLAIKPRVHCLLKSDRQSSDFFPPPWKEINCKRS